ncbi:MAG: NAD(P)/FAD-dependent oxidoreductase [Geminicoccaceae bacterium]
MAGMVIIGAGECGVRAAFALRKHGFSGPVTVIGEENALPYERPPLSKGWMAEPKVIRKEEAYTEADIDLRLGTRVNAIDIDGKRLRLKDGDSVGYDHLLIATGARARRFPGMEDCLTLRTDGDAGRIMQRIRSGSRVGIIGGGFIGLELAATARQAGAEVTVIEAGPRILGRAVPEQIARIVHARHAAEGVDVRTGTADAAADANTIKLTDGTDLDFDVVIAGVGAVPNTILAEAGGLQVENGIRVDRTFRTSAPTVFAAGDCCNFPWRGQRVRLESWKAAQDQGAHAAGAMLGESAEYASVPWFWADQYDLTLQVAGLFKPGWETRERAASTETKLIFQCDEAGRLAAAAGIGPGNSVAKDIRLFEKLIERGTPLEPARLADPSINLKSLLKAA